MLIYRNIKNELRLSAHRHGTQGGYSQKLSEANQDPFKNINLPMYAIPWD